MKKTLTPPRGLTTAAALLLCLACLLSAAGCAKKQANLSIWDTAAYTENTELGHGAKTVTVKVEAADKAVTLTLRTDAETLGEALLENGLTENAVFFTTLNGMTADWNKDQAYWAFHQGGKLMQIGVGDAYIEDGDEEYVFIYSQ